MNTVKISNLLNTVKKHWYPMVKTGLMTVPTNEKVYDALLELLGKLLDVVEENEQHPINSLIDIVSHNIEQYEYEHYGNIDEEIDAADVLNYLMKEHNLKQIDLENEIGKQSVVSEILNRRRTLTAEQIVRLSKRFKVSADLFLPKI